jgi:hypothetical protein
MLIRSEKVSQTDIRIRRKNTSLKLRTAQEGDAAKGFFRGLSGDGIQ